MAVAVHLLFRDVLRRRGGGTLNAGIGAVSRGQWRPPTPLGLTKAAGFFRVVLPQAVRHVLPICKSASSSP